MKNQISGSQVLPMPWVSGKVTLTGLFPDALRSYQLINRHLFSIIVSLLTAFILGTGSSSLTGTGSPTASNATYPGLAKIRKFPGTAAKKTTPQKIPRQCDGNPVNKSSSLFAMCPVFAQNFASQLDGGIDERIFSIYIGAPEANQEAQYYTADRENVQIKSGNLVISALNTPRNGFSYTSGRIDTKGKQDFLYGRIVVRATLPNNVGAWPAIWMLPSEYKYSTKPVRSAGDYYQRYLDNGEIDIAESVGTQPNTIYGIAHSLAYPRDGEDRGYYGTAFVPRNDSTFHDYALDWTPTKLTFSVDGTVFFSISKKPGADYTSWPYDQKFYLVLNVALGGVWGGTNRKDFPKDGVDSSSLPARMNISSIYYYPYTGK